VRRTVIIVPELLGEPSLLRQKLPALEQMSELGDLFKLQPTPKLDTPEALYLGLNPDQGQLRQGPLTVAALGAEPPTRSTHLHLSLLSYHDGVASVPRFEITPEEQREIFGLAKKLNTKLLTIVEGEGLDHGLVWEALGDLRTIPPVELDGKLIRPNLPEGDGDVALRRFIDDSINLLSEIELNERRRGDDLPPLNLLWPWGEGTRLPLPNLALKRGEPALVISSSMRLEGLARLSGYRHAKRGEFGKGTNLRLEWIVKQVMVNPVTIVVIDSIAEFRQREQFEEAEWMANEIDRRLLQPLFQDALTNPTRIVLLAPGSGLGLGVRFETLDSGSNSIPFDERALDEKMLATKSLPETVAASL